MADLSIRDFGQGMILAVFGLTVVIGFSGSMFNVYDADVQSDTLSEIKERTNSSKIGPGQYKNRTQGIDVNENSFLSPSGFGIIQDTFNNIGKLGNILGIAVGELGLPGIIVFLITGIITIAVIFQAISALFGYNV